MTPTLTTPGNPQNIAGGKVLKTHSRFNNSYPVFFTARFGEYTPHFAFETVPADRDISLLCRHSLRTYTLRSPVVNNVKINKDYFNVPLQAIIPFNYEKWKTNPVQGDDCPADAGPTVKDFVSKAFAFCEFLRPSSFGSTTSPTDLFRYLAALSWFFSEGSLLLACEIRIGNFVYFGFDSDTSLDDFVDRLFLSMANANVRFLWNGYTVLSSVDPTNEGDGIISYREFWMRFLHQPVFLIEDIDASFQNFFNDFFVAEPVVSYVGSGLSSPDVDLRRLHAYNIACAHFYSNDHIDYIYTAELYRQNQRSFFRQLSYDTLMFFQMNGVNYEYDALSGHAVDLMLSGRDSTAVTIYLSYFANIFNFNRSLRFMDYFTGSRAFPLAVGNTEVPVVGNNVSVIDITKGIQRQRFLNAVNRSGSKFEAYIKNLFGVRPAYDYHNPFFVGHTSDDVKASETENTGSAQFSDVDNLNTAQNSVTSKMFSQSSKYAFNFDSDRDSVLVGITYFDIPRFYPFGVSRMQQHVDRFDSFIPQAQFIGDQEVRASELGALNDGNFGYQTRYQEYKIRIPYCFGGVRKYLKTWSFLFPAHSYGSQVSPDFIRSIESEFDKFYLSLTGYSLASYFHFIVLSNNEVSSSRPMVKSPSIL